MLRTATLVAAMSARTVAHSKRMVTFPYTCLSTVQLVAERVGRWNRHSRGNAYGIVQNVKTPARG